jgi:DNA polymerase III delta subunit
MGSAEEEALLQRDMRRDASVQVLRLLRQLPPGGCFRGERRHACARNCQGRCPCASALTHSPANSVARCHRSGWCAVRNRCWFSNVPAAYAKLRALSGCTEREIHNADGGFDWNQLREAAGNLSLFGDRRLIELRLGRVPAPDGQKALAAWCERPAEDTVLLITAGAFDKKQMKTAWIDAIDKAGIVIETLAVQRAQLPQWMSRRLGMHGVTADRDALDFLADRVEGNLLAAQQEVDRIALLFGKGNLSREQLMSVVADNARYELEGALDAALAGDAVRALRMLDGLREEGESTVPLLWLVQRDVRGLLLAAELVAQGRPRTTSAAERRCLG